jgi:hypothetical protein
MGKCNLLSSVHVVVFRPLPLLLLLLGPTCGPFSCCPKAKAEKHPLPSHLETNIVHTPEFGDFGEPLGVLTCKGEAAEWANGQV